LVPLLVSLFIPYFASIDSYPPYFVGIGSSFPPPYLELDDVVPLFELPYFDVSFVSRFKLEYFGIGVSLVSRFKLEYFGVGVSLVSRFKLEYFGVGVSLVSLLKLEYLGVSVLSLFKLEYLEAGVSLVSLLKLEYFEDVSLSRFKLEYLSLLIGVSLFSLLKLPYLVVVSLSLLNASLQLRVPPPSNLELLPESNLEVPDPESNLEVPPESVLAVLTGRLPYFGRDVFESELARLDLQLDDDVLEPYLLPVPEYPVSVEVE